METNPDQPPYRIIDAPEADLPIQPPPANRILTVRLAANEDVEWSWSQTPAGQRYVSGYRIIDRAPVA